MLKISNKNNIISGEGGNNERNRPYTMRCYPLDFVLLFNWR